MYCSHCGNSLSGVGKFCPVCGGAIPAAAGPAPPGMAPLESSPPLASPQPAAQVPGARSGSQASLPPIDKGLYLAALGIAGGTAALCSFMATIGVLKQDVLAAETAKEYAAVSMAAGLICIPCWLRLWYRLWESIQDGNARATPGKAIGYLFIPIYSLYWMFQVSYGFITDFNAYAKRGGVPRLVEGRR